jgi:nifR3 family TIM-barrel protein
MLKIGNIELEIPVILCPMADVTNLPYRLLCSKDCNALFIHEMVATPAIANAKVKIEKLVDTSLKEKIRSVQLYVLDKETSYIATKKLLDNNLVDHIDLNFGCPVRKVTSIGAGSAIPWKIDKFTEIIKSVIKASENKIPITIKIRKGIDKEHETCIKASKIAESLGVKAIILHSRYANQYYSGNADWHAIEKLKNSVNIPVIGNGDIFSLDDFARMLKIADGVGIARGALGRPWFFKQIALFYKNKTNEFTITLKDVTDTIFEHSKSLLSYVEKRNIHKDISVIEKKVFTQFRKFYHWYFTGIHIGKKFREKLSHISSFSEQQHVLNEIIDFIGLNTKIDEHDIRGKRSAGNTPKKVYLPDRWLNSNES